ncbi:MAG: antibiotic biosynthesis monooxygenase [Verrucomicrobiota bacterium]|nr:antibiotic biosynthesis monooxygenase [Verrucomicrobiota bacterium]MEE2615077.1 antibiotic biosynthesis monooxygenase [Verrucomicrobiota bacterium]
MNPKDKPFILIARVRVKSGKVEDYLKIAELVDAEVEKTEPGMLLHNFDSDPTDPLQFTWTELYKDDESLINHLNNPPVQDYVAKHLELAESLEVEIYGTLDDKTVEYLTVAWGEAGIPFKYFKSTRVGYIRDSIVT